jgi:hypothetical protein
MRGVALLLLSSLLAAAFAVSSDVASVKSLDQQSDKHSVERLAQAQVLHNTQQLHPNEDRIATALRDNFHPEARAAEALSQHSLNGGHLYNQDDADDMHGAEEGVHRFIGGQVAEGGESKALVDAETREGMQVSADAELEPISMGVMAGAKAIAVAAQLVVGHISGSSTPSIGIDIYLCCSMQFTIATARKAASIEMAGKQTEKIAEELEEELTKLEKFLS